MTNLFLPSHLMHRKIFKRLCVFSPKPYTVLIHSIVLSASSTILSPPSIASWKPLSSHRGKAHIPSGIPRTISVASFVWLKIVISCHANRSNSNDAIPSTRSRIDQVRLSHAIPEPICPIPTGLPISKLPLPRLPPGRQILLSLEERHPIESV